MGNKATPPRSFNTIRHSQTKERAQRQRTQRVVLLSIFVILGAMVLSILVLGALSIANAIIDNLTEETTTLADCFFSEDGMEANQNDTNITKQYDLHPYRIFTDASAQTNRSAELYAGGITATT
jgi:hypothetical protein